jgi:hypothetical protein
MLIWALVDLKTPSSHFLPPYISLKDFIKMKLEVLKYLKIFKYEFP